jgi:hypothetical protein
MTAPSHRSVMVQTLGVLSLFSICGANILYGIVVLGCSGSCNWLQSLTDVAQRGSLFYFMSMYSRPLLLRDLEPRHGL